MNKDVTTVKPRAWLREPKVQRHYWRPLVRGVSVVEPTDEEREFAELDGEQLVPLYDQVALDAAVAAERGVMVAAIQHALHWMEAAGFGDVPAAQQMRASIGCHLASAAIQYRRVAGANL